jgi:hypothetical protein
VAPYCPWHNLRTFAFLFALEYFIDCFEYQGIDPFYCTIRLRVIYRCECDLHFNLLVEILEHCTGEVLCIVHCDVSGNAVVIDDILSEELFDYCGAYICDGLRLDLLCEVLDCHHSKGVIALHWCQLVNDVDAPSLERPQ